MSQIIKITHDNFPMESIPPQGTISFHHSDGTIQTLKRQTRTSYNRMVQVLLPKYNLCFLCNTVNLDLLPCTGCGTNYCLDCLDSTLSPSGCLNCPDEKIYNNEMTIRISSLDDSDLFTIKNMDIFGVFDDNKYHIPGFFPEYTVLFNRVLDDCTCMNVAGNICSIIKIIDNNTNNTDRRELLNKLKKYIVSSIPETIEALCKLKYKKLGIISMLGLETNVSIHDFYEDEPEYKFVVCSTSGDPLMIYNNYIDAKTSGLYCNNSNYSILPVEYYNIPA